MGIKDLDDVRLLGFSINASESSKLYRNYIMFCVCFSVTHGSVDSVLDYASSEIGISLASYSGSVLYFFYTISALLLAKPCVIFLGPKYSSLCGLLSFLIYVGSFFLSILFPLHAWGLFLTGATICGIGAGIAWTAHGAYYARNAELYAIATNTSQTIVNANFAAIFAGAYLGFETFCKALATIVYLVNHGSKSWRPIAFGLYSTASLIAFLCCCKVSSLDVRITSTNKININEVYSQTKAVGTAIWNSRKLSLLIPYQICFGLHAGFIGYYVNREIVALGIGDGYIGIVASLATFTATILAFPFAEISNRASKWYVMIFGGIAFTFCGLCLLIFTDKQMGNWGFIVIFYMIHGAARGVWENTNKAVVADYFTNEKERETAYAAVYFTSGLAGAFGYACFQFFSRNLLATINTLVPLLALICYHLSSKIAAISTKSNLSTAENDNSSDFQPSSYKEDRLEAEDDEFDNNNFERKESQTSCDNMIDVNGYKKSIEMTSFA